MPAAKPKIEKQCPICEVSFYVKPSVVDIRRCCSVTCQANWKKRNNILRVCITCSKEFWVRPSDMKKGSATYCSRECLKPMYRRMLTGNKYRQAGEPWNKGLTNVKTGRKGSRPHVIPWNKIGDGVTNKSRLERTRFRRVMQAKIFQRDNYTCSICDQYGANIQVDHIKSWSEYPELRFVPENCRTLCMACHYYVTFKRKLPRGVVWGHNLNRRIV